MKKILVLILTVAYGAACASAMIDGSDSIFLDSLPGDQIQIAPDLKISDWSCFLYEKGIGGRLHRRIFSGGHVELGQKFGCTIDFVTTRKQVQLRSELRGPASMIASSHPKADTVSFSDDGMSVFTLLYVDGRKQLTGYWWSLDSSDPRGRYEMRVWLEGVLIAELEVQSD